MIKLVGNLEWPAGVPRRTDKWKKGVFTSDGKPVTVDSALVRVEIELKRWKSEDIEVSANFGRTKAGNVSRTWSGLDPGVAIRYSREGKDYCIQCDTYAELPQNIAAIAADLEARRAIERYGVSSPDQLMAQFAALPAPPSWRAILGCAQSTTIYHAEIGYRRLAKKHHPDTGGDPDQFRLITEAIAQARKELG